MAKSITVRDVPDKVRDKLAERAARAGRSMQEHLRAELIEWANRPTVDEVIARAGARVSATKSRISAKHILQYRNADKK
ncbi:MAG: FitA-like ribbon-helix-helix domain-containing protein [Actinomycetota bacterium]